MQTMHSSWSLGRNNAYHSTCPQATSRTPAVVILSSHNGKKRRAPPNSAVAKDRIVFVIKPDTATETLPQPPSGKPTRRPTAAKDRKKGRNQQAPAVYNRDGTVNITLPLLVSDNLRPADSDNAVLFKNGKPVTITGYVSLDLTEPNSSSIDSLAVPAFSSSMLDEEYTPQWMSSAAFQQFAGDQLPTSSAAYGSTQLRSGAGAVTFYPQLTAEMDRAAQPAFSFLHTPVESFAADSVSSHSTAVVPDVSSSSSSMMGEVDVMLGDNTSYTRIMDPLCQEVILLEDLEEMSQPEISAVAALTAARDEAIASARAKVEQLKKLEQKLEMYKHKLAQLHAQVRQLQQQSEMQAHSNSSNSSSSTPVSTACNGGSSGSSSKASSDCCTVEFSITCPTAFGQRLWLVGDAAALGSWDLGSALRLKWSEGGNWVGSVELDAGAAAGISYKAVLEHAPGQYKWAAGENCQLALTAASLSVAHKFA